MPGDFIRIEGLESIDKLLLALKRFPQQVKRNLGAAGLEAVKRVIFPVQGLKRYPPATAANQPPTPYYIRGRGTQYKSRHTGSSVRYGTQWYSKSQGYATEIGNRASYARWLAGEEQARHMAPKGWRKLIDVVNEKMADITKVYQAWIDRTLREIGLK